MIYWEEYKRHKLTAEKILTTGTQDVFLSLEKTKYTYNKISLEEYIENCIEILSDYKHINPFKK